MPQVGMAGELMVSGIQLAREYLHNPEKTAASFIPNPHNHDNHPDHTRVYRTGMTPSQAHRMEVPWCSRRRLAYARHVRSSCIARTDPAVSCR